MATPEQLERFAETAGRMGDMFGGPMGAVGPVARKLLEAAADAMRQNGETAEQIIARIHSPRDLDTSFRDDIDRQIEAKRKKE